MCAKRYNLIVENDRIIIKTVSKPWSECSFSFDIYKKILEIYFVTLRRSARYDQESSFNIIDFNFSQI